jgi:hypothetical protein
MNWTLDRPVSNVVGVLTLPALLAVASGLALGLGLIVAIGAQNAFVLRQGLRLEHVATVVAVCALSDLALIVAGVLGAGAALSRSRGSFRWCASPGRRFCSATACWPRDGPCVPAHFSPRPPAPAPVSQ